MALNKRTIILLIVAIVVWAVAIFVLIRMNSPKPQPVQTSSNITQSSTLSSDSSLSSSPGVSISSTNTTNPQVLSFVELQNIMPESTFTNIFTPFVLKLNFPIGTKYSWQSDSKQVSNNAYGGKANINVQDIENISNPEFQYLGYLALYEGRNERKKIYVKVGTETKSFFDTELLDNRYKVLNISSTEIILLDTFDGKIKKLSYLGTQK
ncbi:MAG: hypothetical protein ACP5JS_02525 [Fervidobacterium sp.]